ncbi:hypothetical protein [Solitalea koreensis]|uniref:SprB repeat-containing protein n=1 Tax=Solitalea koreensis TaxID=543615 RepID=A0A521CG64_9SPHI|nr:hypothetical protein [Solitalea koreensis]SMO58418.1 hypothetical protein SAMN06265350_10437 [Solitalea koreensis]
MRNKYTITPKTIGHKILLLVFPLLFFANYAFGQVSCPIVIKEPSTAAFTSSPQTICIGNSTNLVIHLNRDSQGPATTSWVLKYSDGASTTTINTSAPPSGVVVTSGANSVDLTIPVTPTTTTTYSIVDLSDSWFGTASNCNYTSPYTNSVTITVTPDATIALSSAAATTNQTPCINTAITDITYAIGNATGATVTGLPAGVTGTYASGVFTISGTPTASGTFNYTVSTTGSCVTPSLSGTITITPDATIALSSAAATTNQTPCINTAITDITYAIGNATGATVTGLPAGVTGTYASGVFTISGTPTASGTFNYTVSTTGSCVTPSLSGTITINAPITFTSTYTNVACANAPSTAAITVTLNGGSGSYKLILQLNGVNYKTDTVTGTTYSFTGLPKGSYTIIVEDANVNGCAGTCNGATLTP